MNDPFKIIEPTVISFSGGRTSAYMLWRILQSNDGLPDDAIVVFANTGKEEEATLQFVKDCSDKWNVPITWVEYKWAEEPKDRFKIVTFETASRNGQPFEDLINNKTCLPNPVARFCSIELKIRTIAKYCKSININITEYDAWVGIRADEHRRASKIEPHRIPLVADNITVQDISKFWNKQNFDLGLPNMNGKTMHGNCDLCFLKPAHQIQSLIQEKPSRAIWWINMENIAKDKTDLSVGLGHLFRQDRPSYQQMYDYAMNQSDMFDKDEESIPCFCGD